jgi:hypothetical protein
LKDIDKTLAADMGGSMALTWFQTVN